MKPNKYILACAMFVAAIDGGRALRKVSSPNHWHARFAERDDNH